MARKRISRKRVIELYKQGMGPSKIGEIVGASKSTISDMIKGLIIQKLNEEPSNQGERSDSSFKEIDLELSNLPCGEIHLPKKFQSEFTTVENGIVKINQIEFPSPLLHYVQI
jgi:hypothetical protein